MKKLGLLSAILLIGLFSGCGGDDDAEVFPVGDGFLTQITSSLNSNAFETITVGYDGQQRMNSITVTSEGFQEVTYEVQYVGEEIGGLTIQIDYLTSGVTNLEGYDVMIQGNEITLMPTGNGIKRLFRSTNGFVDYSKNYFGPDDAYFYETVFNRDANNNIESTAYFVTNQTDTDLKVFKYTFSDFATDFDFPAAFNPVLYFSNATYDPYLGAVLGLRISEDAPMKSSYWDGAGTMRDENITATPDPVNGFLRGLSYQFVELQDNNYQMDFTYE